MTSPGRPRRKPIIPTYLLGFLFYLGWLIGIVYSLLTL